MRWGVPGTLPGTHLRHVPSDRPVPPGAVRHRKTGPPAMRGRLRPRPDSLTNVLTRPFIETRLGVPRLVSINHPDNQPRVTLTKPLYLIYTESRRSRDEVDRGQIVAWRAGQASHATARLPARLPMSLVSVWPPAWPPAEYGLGLVKAEAIGRSRDQSSTSTFWSRSRTVVIGPRLAFGSTLSYLLIRY